MEMLSYIFGSLKYSEDNIRKMKKILRVQSKLNGQLAIFAVVTTVYLITTELKIREQEKKLNKLNKEIEELKHVEGV